MVIEPKAEVFGLFNTNTNHINEEQCLWEFLCDTNFICQAQKILKTFPLG